MSAALRRSPSQWKRYTLASSYRLPSLWEAQTRGTSGWGGCLFSTLPIAKPNHPSPPRLRRPSQREGDALAVAYRPPSQWKRYTLASSCRSPSLWEGQTRGTSGWGGRGFINQSNFHRPIQLIHKPIQFLASWWIPDQTVNTETLPGCADPPRGRVIESASDGRLLAAQM